MYRARLLDIYHSTKSAKSSTFHGRQAGGGRPLAQLAEIGALRMHAEGATAFVQEFQSAGRPLPEPIAPSRFYTATSAAAYPLRFVSSSWLCCSQ